MIACRDLWCTGNKGKRHEGIKYECAPVNLGLLDLWTDVAASEWMGILIPEEIKALGED